MPSLLPRFGSRFAPRRGTRLFAVLLLGVALATCAPAWGVCGQTGPASERVLANGPSDAARAVLSLNEVLSGDASAQVAGLQASSGRAGIDVLRSRAKAVRQLIQLHPEEVRSVALPAAAVARWLAADSANAQFLEHDATVRGELRSMVADDFSSGTDETVFVVHDRATGSVVGIHIAGSLRLHPLLNRSIVAGGVQLGTDLAVETVLPALPEGLRPDGQQLPGGQASAVGQSAALPQGTPASVTLALPAGAVAAPTALTCSATGAQKTAVLMLQFPNNTPAFPGSYGTAGWWTQAITGTGSSVNSLWSEMTAGATYATVDVFGPLALPQRYGCADYLSLRSAALTLASTTIDLSKYTRVVLGFPETSCTYGGLADIGCNGADSFVPHPYSVVWMPIVTTYTASTGVWGSLAHELGHNLGLNHANTLDFGAISLGPIDFQATNPGTVGGTGATTATGAVTAVDTEYGDRFSVMGNPWNGPGPYSAEHRAKLLGWVPAFGSASGLGTVTAAGSYTIQPASSGTALRALRVLRDSTSASWIWLEYRDGGTPFDSANLAAVPGQNVTRGAVVHYENGYGDHEKTYQLDMTPTGKGNNFADGALAVGSSWSDPFSPLSLTVNSITSAGLNVSVAYDSTCAAFALSGGPVSAAGGSGTVTVTAGAGCNWTATSNAAWVTLSGTTAGSGNGSFTWTAVANTGVGQRVTYVTVGRASQRLLQLGSGANVLALSAASANVAPGTSTVLSLTLSDAVGVADLQTVTLNAMAPGAQPCTVEAYIAPSGTATLYLLENESGEYTSGIAAGGSGSVSTTGCTLSGQASGLSSSGSNITLALNLAFPAGAPGVRALYATANSGTELPVGILNVGTASTTTGTGTGTGTLTATTTVLTGTPLNALPGAAVTLNAAVTPGSGGAMPTGSITMLDGTNPLGSVALDASGKVSLTTTTLLNGAHTLTAVYGGSTTFAASTSAAVTVTVAPAATIATLNTSASTVPAGGGVTLTVGVGHMLGSSAPGGTATLRENGATLATVALSNGAASFPLRGLSAGTHNYTATYSGDATYLASTSNVVTVVVGQPAATLTVTSTPVVLAGAPVTITVTAGGASATGAQPTGTVQLQDGAQNLGSVTLVSGTAVFTTGSMLTGTHTVTATYGGDGVFAAAVSTTMTVNVVDFRLSGPGSPANIAIAAGALTGNTATVTLTPGSNGFPVGVAFACYGAPAEATCSVTPGTVTPGSATVPVTVTVTTTAPSSKIMRTMAAWLGLPLLGFLLGGREQRFVPRLFAMLIALVALSAGISGCGTGVSGSISDATTSTTGTGVVTGTPAGTSTLTVQATAASGGATLVHTATVTLQVN